jgi:hypothetical protein
MAKLNPSDFKDFFKDETKKEAHTSKNKKPETLAERKVRLSEFYDPMGRFKSDTMTFTNHEAVKTNVSVRTTQLDRYRFSNEMAHVKTTDAVLSNGKQIRFEGSELKPGARVFEIVSDGLDPLYDENYSIKNKSLFSVKMGKVTEAVPFSERHSASSNLKSFYSDMMVDEARQRVATRDKYTSATVYGGKTLNIAGPIAAGSAITYSDLTQVSDGKIKLTSPIVGSIQVKGGFISDVQIATATRIESSLGKGSIDLK